MVGDDEWSVRAVVVVVRLRRGRRVMNRGCENVNVVSLDDMVVEEGCKRRYQRSVIGWMAWSGVDG
jgi:hypothetical protein